MTEIKPQQAQRAAVTGKVIASLMLLVFVAATALFLGFGFLAPRCASELEKRAAELGLYARQMAAAEQQQAQASSSVVGESVSGSAARCRPLEMSERTSYLVGSVALAGSNFARCVGTAIAYSGWMGFGGGFFAALAVSSIVALIRWTHASKNTSDVQKVM